VRFDYYERLTRRQQTIYRKSDAVTVLKLPDAAALKPLVGAVGDALAGQRCAEVQAACKRLVERLLGQLGVPPVRIRVLAVRPRSAESELHGLYERDEDSGKAVISVWMRTAAKKQVVAFRTFMRTLLHELCHHLDYDLLKLADSYHTQGFFKRESSLARQLLEPSRRSATANAASAPTRRAAKKVPVKKPKRRRWKQLELPFFG